MPETVRLSRIYLEDMDIGVGTRTVRLFDGSSSALTKVSIPGFATIRTTRVTATAAATTLAAANLIQSGDRVLGVTLKIITGLGTTSGLTGYTVGDGTVIDRWGSLTTFTINYETTQGNFLTGDWPIYPSGVSIIISALGGTFDGTGLIEVTAHTMQLTHRSA